MEGRFKTFRHGGGAGFISFYAVRYGIAVETARVSPPEEGIDNLSRRRVNLAGLTAQWLA
jgi:hypothetical protein